MTIPVAVMITGRWLSPRWLNEKKEKQQLVIAYCQLGINLLVLYFWTRSRDATPTDEKLTTCVTLAADKRIGQKRSLRASTRRELSFGTNGVLIRRV
jgi:hypothetical protein